MNTTLARMAKKKAPPSTDAEPAGEKPRTDTVRVEADLARMATITSIALGVSVSDLLSPMIRPALTKRYKEVVRRMNAELPDCDHA